ncbi:MAG: Ferredoxin [Oscillospiraceae bacterium]|jgi:ferredoxin|nr:Ferredoxin [Oscillospiraceae bacterium]
MLIVLFPVYALNAPQPIYEYIKSLSKANKTPAVVISVSGGGEITPNTACRLHCIRHLEKKGYEVVYEQMLVMPSNIFMQTPNQLSVLLLEILPAKVEKIVDDLFLGVTRRTRPNLLDRFFSSAAEFYKSKHGSARLGKRIKLNEACTGCGLCARSCPRENIMIQDKVPVFGGECVLCLKCIYGCPAKALSLSGDKFIVIKQGYDLDTIEQLKSEEDSTPIEELAKGYMLNGVKKYLLDKEN